MGWKVIQDWIHAAQEDRRQAYTRIQGSKELGAGKTRHLMATYNDNIRKHGTSGRQGKIGIQETKSRFRRLVSEQ